MTVPPSGLTRTISKLGLIAGVVAAPPPALPVLATVLDVVPAAEDTAPLADLGAAGRAGAADWPTASEAGAPPVAPDVAACSWAAPAPAFEGELVEPLSLVEDWAAGASVDGAEVPAWPEEVPPLGAGVPAVEGAVVTVGVGALPSPTPSRLIA
jgi:hypothetical protein